MSQVKVTKYLLFQKIVLGVDGEPSHLLGIPEAKGHTSESEFEVIKATLEERGIRPEQCVGLVFDTTLTNTGEWSGICTRLAQYFNVPILWCGCRKHIIELRVKWFIVARTGQTKDPGRKLFRRFQGQFVAMQEHLKKEHLVRMDLASKPPWVQELGQEILRWALELYSRGSFPRDDYAEFLSFVIFHLGGEVESFWPLRMPGPDHQARWMADCVYNMKMLSCSSVFPLSEQELAEVEDISEYVVLFHAKPWFESSLASEAAVSDITFLCHIQRRYKISQVWKVCDTFYRQLWYLTGELIPLALASKTLPAEELEALAKALHQAEREPPSIGKPHFPTITISLTPHPTPPKMASFVISDSWAIFYRLGLDGLNDWLLLPCKLWPLFPPFNKLCSFVRNLAVTNDLAERGCHLMTEFINRVQSPTARAALVACVSNHREKMKDFTKKSLENC